MVTDAEKEQLVTLLQKLEPGLLPFDVFHQLARLYVTPIIIVVPLRVNAKKEIEVLLTKREHTDPIWPDKLALPGTVIRATDTKDSYIDAFERIRAELNVESLGQPIFVQPRFYQCDRGAELTLIHWVRPEEEPKIGQWYLVSDLPADCVTSDIPTLQIANENFKKTL